MQKVSLFFLSLIFSSLPAMGNETLPNILGTGEKLFLRNITKFSPQKKIQILKRRLDWEIQNNTPDRFLYVLTHELGKLDIDTEKEFIKKVNIKFISSIDKSTLDLSKKTKDIISVLNFYNYPLKNPHLFFNLARKLTTSKTSPETKYFAIIYFSDSYKKNGLFSNAIELLKGNKEFTKEQFTNIQLKQSEIFFKIGMYKKAKKLSEKILSTVEIESIIYIQSKIIQFASTNFKNADNVYEAYKKIAFLSEKYIPLNNWLKYEMVSKLIYGDNLNKVNSVLESMPPNDQGTIILKSRLDRMNGKYDKAKELLKSTSHIRNNSVYVFDNIYREIELFFISLYAKKHHLSSSQIKIIFKYCPDEFTREVFCDPLKKIQENLLKRNKITLSTSPPIKSVDPGFFLNREIMRYLSEMKE